MRKRDSAGLAIAPVFLRLVLAVVFIWAGLGKFVGKIEVQGTDAAILANYGVLDNPHAPRSAPPPTDSDGTVDPIAPTEESPSPEDSGNESDSPQASHREGSGWLAAESAPPTARLVAFQTDGTVPILATAADFPDPVEVRGYANLVLLLHNRIHPEIDPEDSSPRMRLWPDFDASTDYDPWPRYAALAAALTELIAGILLLVGLLTRLSAFSIACVMLTAMWLTVIGPAIQSGDTRLGFLPNYELFGSGEWMLLLYQFSLLGHALALVFAGPGMLSIDRLLLGGPKKAAAPSKPQGQGKKS